MSSTRVYDPTVDASAIERFKLAYMMQFLVQNKRRFKFPKIRLQDLYHRIINDFDGTPICDIIARILRYLKHDQQITISTADSALDNFVQEKRTNYRMNIQRIKSFAKSIRELKPEYRAGLLENLIECICDDFPDLFNFDFKKTDGCEDEDECMIVKAGHDSQGCSYYYMDDLRLYRERPQNSIISDWDVVVGPSRDQWVSFIQSLSTNGEEYDLRIFLSESLLDFVTTSLESGNLLNSQNPELDSDFIRKKEAMELNMWNSYSTQASVMNNKAPIKEETNSMPCNSNVQEYSSNINHSVKSEPDLQNNPSSNLNNNTVQSNSSNQSNTNGGTTPQPSDLNSSLTSNGPASVGSKPETPGQSGNSTSTVLTSPVMNCGAVSSPKGSTQVAHHLSAPNSVNPVLPNNPGTPGVVQPTITRPGSVPQLTPPQMSAGTPPQNSSTSNSNMTATTNPSLVTPPASTANSAPSVRNNQPGMMDCQQMSVQQQHPQSWTQQHPPPGQCMPGQHPSMMSGGGSSYPPQGRGYLPNQVLVFTTDMLNEAAKECPRQNIHLAHYHQHHPAVKQLLAEQHKQHALMESGGGGAWPPSLMHKESATMTQEQLENRKAKMAELERIQQSMKKSSQAMPSGQTPQSMMQYAHLEAGPPMEPGQTPQQYHDAKQEWLRLRNEFVKEKEKDEIMRIRMQGGVPQMGPGEAHYGPYHPGRPSQYPGYPGMSSHPHHAGGAAMHPGMSRRMPHPMMMDSMQMPAQKRPYPGGPMPNSGPYHYPTSGPGRGPPNDMVMQAQRMPMPGPPYEAMPCAPTDANMMGCMPGPMPAGVAPGPVHGVRTNSTSTGASTTTTTKSGSSGGSSKSTKRRKLSKAQQQAQAAAAAAAAAQEQAASSAAPGPNASSGPKLEPGVLPGDATAPSGYMMHGALDNPEHTITRQYNSGFHDHLPDCAKMPPGSAAMMSNPSHNGGQSFKHQQPPNSLPPQSASTPDFSRASSNILLNRPSSQPGHQGHAFPSGPPSHHHQHNSSGSNSMHHPSSGSTPANLPYTNSNAITSSSTSSNSKMSQNLTSASLASLARLSNQMGAPVGPFNNLQESQTGGSGSGSAAQSATQHHHPVSTQHSHLPHHQQPQQPQPSIQVNNTFVNAQLNVQQMNYQHVNGPGVTSQMQIQQHVHQQSTSSIPNQQTPSTYPANQTNTSQTAASNQNTTTSGPVVSANSNAAGSYGNASVQIQTKTPHTIQYMPADPQQQMTAGNNMINGPGSRMVNKMMDPAAYPAMQGQPNSLQNPYGGPNNSMQDMMDSSMSVQRSKYYNQGQPNQRMGMMEMPPGSGYAMPPNSNIPSDSKVYSSANNSGQMNASGPTNHAVQMMQQGQMIQGGQAGALQIQQQQQQFQMQYSMSSAGAASMQMQHQQMRAQAGGHYPMEWPGAGPPPHDMTQQQYEACYSQQQQYYQSSGPGPRPSPMQPGMSRQGSGGGSMPGYPVSGHPNAMM